jgi:cytochrome P450
MSHSQCTHFRAGGPKGVGIVRAANDFRRSGLPALERLAERYGDIVGGRFLGFRAFLLCHPDLVHHVLIKNRENYAKMDAGENAKKFFGNPMQLNNGEHALALRRAMAPIFQPERLARSYGKVVADATNRAMNSWNPGRHRAITPHLSDLVLDIALQIHFGSDPGNDTKRVGELFLAAMSSLRNFMPPHWFPSPGNRRYHRSLAELDKEIFRRIKNCDDVGTNKSDFLSMLVRLKADAPNLLTDAQIRDEIVTMMSAGYQTMAIALNQSLRLVAENPAVDEEILRELRLLSTGGLDGVNDISKMDYIEKVIKESLRCCPPAGVIARRAVAEDRIGDSKIPAGSRVFISSWVMHRSPRYFDDPLAFKPERWSPGFEHSLPSCVYLPFGRGPRTCIASTLSMMILQLTLATILQRYRFEAVHTMSPAQSSWPGILKAGGLQVTVHDRGAS